MPFLQGKYRKKARGGGVCAARVFSLSYFFGTARRALCERAYMRFLLGGGGHTSNNKTKNGKKIDENMTVLPPLTATKSKKKRGRPLSIKKASDLEALIEKYFSSISYREPVKDACGAIRTDIDGEIVERTVYISPPDVMSLCLFLGITDSTWENYSNPEKHPDFAPICKRTRMRMEAYLREVLVTREKGSLQGVIFNLQNNYGWRDKKTVDLGDETRDVLSGLSLSEKMAMVSDLKSGALDIPDDIPTSEDDEE